MLDKMSALPLPNQSDALRNTLLGLRTNGVDTADWVRAEFDIGSVSDYLSAITRCTQDWTLWKGVDGHVRLGIGFKSRQVFSDWEGAKRHLNRTNHKPPVTFFGGRFDRTRTHTKSPWFSWPAIETYTPLVVLEWTSVDAVRGDIHLPQDGLEAAINALTTLREWTH